MAEAAAAGEAPAAPAAGGRKTGMVIGLTFAGAVLGGVAAALVIAPRIIARQAPVVADSAHVETPGDSPEPEAEAGGERQLVELENIIVNPAGSNGNRFLMASVAFSVTDEKVQKILEDREVELRDRVTTILEQMTMSELTAPGARDSLKARITAMAGTIVGPTVPVQVFLPQFVIQ